MSVVRKNIQWNRAGKYFRAEIKLELPPASSFCYVSNAMMSQVFPRPNLERVLDWTRDVFSTDVIVVGNDFENRYVLAGALTAFRSTTDFTAKMRNRTFVSVEMVQRYILPDEEPEETVILEGDDWRELLIRYAKMAAQRMNVKKIPERENLTGYCSWYYYYKNVTQKDFLENLEALKNTSSSYYAQYVQIDDGYQTWQGDWLDCRKEWPGPLELVAEKITESGRKAGIWLMPFTASTASNVYKTHPDWFVHDEKGCLVTVQGWTPPPDDQWACLDTTIPEVREHLKNVFVSFWKMGFSYFKMDALMYGLFEGVRRDKNATPVSAFRLGLQTIREAVPEALLMACSSPLMPCMGLVDHIRVSNDTSRYFGTEKYENENFPRCSGADILSAIRVSLSHFWKFDRWFRCDPDVVMARQDNAFYSRNEAKFSVLGAVMTGITFTSDHFDTIAPDRLKLLEKAQKIRMRKVQPFITSEAGLWPVLYEGEIRGRRAVAVFNDTRFAKKYTLAELELPDCCMELLEDTEIKDSFEISAHNAMLLVEKNI